MSDGALFAITLLLILWITTLLAFIRNYRQRSGNESFRPVPSDMVLDLVARGKREAEASAARLCQVADALMIGLVEKGHRGKVKALNSLARELLEHEGGLQEALSGLGEGVETLFRTGDSRVFQLKHLERRETGSLVVIQEITRTYNRMEQDKAKEKLALLGQMTAQMAHQLKTPLAVLAGEAQMLAKRLSGQRDLEKRARKIYEEARELAGQVGEISTLYKGHGERVPGVKIAGILEEVRSRSGPRNQEVRVEIQCPEDLAATTDPVLLRNLMVLLTQNALEPSVGASRVVLGAGLANNTVTLWVEDDGRGIPKELHEVVFEPFVGSREDGLGLGLFLARDLAERLGASVGLADAAAGTRFEVTFPATPA